MLHEDHAQVPQICPATAVLQVDHEILGLYIQYTRWCLYQWRVVMTSQLRPLVRLLIFSSGLRVLRQSLGLRCLLTAGIQPFDDLK